jgi:hypothetical protein
MQAREGRADEIHPAVARPQRHAGGARREEVGHEDRELGCVAALADD